MTVPLAIGLGLAVVLAAGLLAWHRGVFAGCPTAADLDGAGIAVTYERDTGGELVQLWRRRSDGTLDAHTGAPIFSVTQSLGGLLELSERHTDGPAYDARNRWAGDPDGIFPLEPGARHSLTGARDVVVAGTASSLDLELDIEVGEASETEIGGCAYRSLPVLLRTLAKVKDGRESTIRIFGLYLTDLGMFLPQFWGTPDRIRRGDGGLALAGASP